MRADRSPVPVRQHQRVCGQRPHGQRGQAMVEFVIGATLFLIPLFLIIPMLGKFLDIQSTTAMASRYAAFDRTVSYGGTSSSVSWPSNNKTDAEVLKEVRQRFYRDGAGAFSAADRTTDTLSPRELWKDRTGASLIAGYGQTSTNDSSESLMDKVLGVVTGLLDLIGSTFKPETKGRFTATVSVNANSGQPIGMALEANSTQFGAWNQGSLTFSMSTSILANGWGSAGSTHTKDMVRGLTPTSVFATYGLDNLKWLLVPFDVAWCRLELGKMDVDFVPGDRLQGGATWPSVTAGCP